MVKIMFAMGEFNQFDTQVTKRLCASLVKLTDYLMDVDVIKLLVALAQLQEHEDRRVKTRGKNAEKIGEDYEKTLVLLTWQKVLDIGPAFISPPLLDRISRMHFALKLEHPDWDLPMSERLATAIKQKPSRFDEFKGASFSPLHKEVCLALSAMHVEYENEYHVGVLKVDIALIREKICIEVNGPRHFDRNSGLHTGKSQLKRRMLSNLGWKRLDVTYYEWNRNRTPRDREMFLRGLLDPLLPMHGLGLAKA
jgi:hypothetical protein